MPEVAVITRTMTRPYLLRRAIQSVLSQFFEDYEMIIVNDGGDPKHVDKALEVAFRERPELERFANKIRVIHHKKNKGMEAASNTGIRASDSRYIVIHDDDDSWHPAFLERTVSYLDAPPLPTIKGVITKTLVVFERLIGWDIIYEDTVPFEPWVKNWDWNADMGMERVVIPYDKLCEMNLFPPISFVFSRKVYDKVGGFNENLPVLGDWDFHMKFAAVADIGIIWSRLAYYHHRRTNNPLLGNTVIAGKSKHTLYFDYLRNSILRKTLPPKDIAKDLRDIIVSRSPVREESVWWKFAIVRYEALANKLLNMLYKIKGLFRR